jgi:hypothetical protein
MATKEDLQRLEMATKGRLSAAGNRQPVETFSGWR